MSFFKTRSLRVSILTAFGSLLLVTLTATIAYYHHTASKMAVASGRELMDLETEQVINQTLEFLMPAAKLGTMSARLVQPETTFSLAANDRLERYTLELLNAYPQIEMVYLGDEAGNFLLSKRQPDGTWVTKINVRTDGPSRTIWKYRNQDFQVVHTEVKAPESFDSRQRPWYVGAQKSHKNFWTDVYIFHTGQKPGITFASPVLNPAGALVGVLGVDINLKDLSVFLRTLKIGKHGLAFILSDHGEVVAYPEAGQTVGNTGEDGVLRLVDVSELTNPAVVAAYKEYRKTGARRFAVDSEGQRYLASFADFPTDFHKHWRVGVVVPEDDFVGPIKRANRTALLISLAILAASGLLAVGLSRSISQPILLLTRETEKIREFRLEEAGEFRSSIREIQLLQEAVQRMRVSLKSFTRFAPQEIVREVVVRGREAMLGGERREVTFLFGDLRNFTGFSEKTPPETVVHLLNRHFGAMVEIINAHGGFVIDFLGDSLFAVFGAPQVEKEHARQAVRCAVAMQLARHRLNQENQDHRLPALEMGIGINSGPGVVGNMGSQQRIKYGVVGHAVNLASRVETFTVGGQVLITAATHQAVRDLTHTRGPLEALGKGVGAVQVWEVTGLLEPELSLPPLVPGLTTPVRPQVLPLRRLEGKQVQPEVHTAQVARLSRAGAEIAADCSLAAFSSLQLQFPSVNGEAVWVDARVVGAGEGPDLVLIKFSGVDSELAKSLQEMLA